MTQVLFEIGFEEFPPSFIVPAAEFLRDRLREQCIAARIPPQEIALFSTCRRIAIAIGGLPERQPDLREKVQGAPKKVALAADGSLTKAGEAFLKKYGVTDYFFEPSPEGKGEVMTAWRNEPGKSLEEIVVPIIEETLAAIPFPKTMRWGDKDLLFARPLRWILLLINGKPVAHSFHRIPSAQTSFGHRFLAPAAVPVTSETYRCALEKAFVRADRQERRTVIAAEVRRIARELGGSDILDEELLDEVTDMTEWPVAIVGSIPQEHRNLPPELIALVLKENQRYFTIYTADRTRLLPQFVAFLDNVPSDTSVVIRGCEKVVAARLSDAAFYYEEDKRKNFGSLTDKLSSIIFQKDLGSYRDKVERIAALARFIGERYGNLDAAEITAVTATARLIKNDLLTGVVFEFPELQGTMGRYYALNAGFDETTANAIEEHYLPRFSGDRLPATARGATIAIADKIDTIVGGFMAGMKPSGTKDKFAIRRNAIGLLQIAIERSLPLDLEEASIFAARLIIAHNPRLKLDHEALADFMKQRYYAIFPYDTPIVKSAVEAGWRIPPLVKKRTDLIAKLVEEKEIFTMVQLFKRSRNILKDAPDSEAVPLEEILLREQEEKELFIAVTAVKNTVANAPDDLAAARAIISLKPAIDRFFDKVLVMTDDSSLRNNRMALIRQIVALVTTHIGDIAWLGV